MNNNIHIKLRIYNDNIDHICFIILKAAFEKIRDLDIKKVVFTIKIINLNIKIFAKKTMMALVFEINNGSIHMIITLMNQDIIVLLQIVVLGSEI